MSDLLEACIKVRYNYCSSIPAYISINDQKGKPLLFKPTLRSPEVADGKRSQNAWFVQKAGHN